MQKKFEITSFFLFSFCILAIYSLSFTSFNDFRKLIRILSFCFLIIGISGFLFFKCKCRLESKKLTPITEKKTEYFQENLFTIFVIAISALHFLYIHNSHWKSFFLGDMDYVSMAEVLNNTIKGSYFSTNYHGHLEETNYLTHHFSPALILLSPFLYINEFRLGYGFALLFFNVLSIFALTRYLLSKNINGPGFFFLITFFAINLYVYRLFQSYHFELLFLTFTIFLFLSLHKGNITLTLSLFAICLLTKEDISIYMSLFGIFLILKGQRKIGLSFLLISILYFLFFVPWIQSFLYSGKKMNWLEDWSHWGNTIPEIAMNLIISPEKLLQIFIQKKSLIFELSLSFGFLFYFYPKIFLVLVPILIFHFSSGRIWFNEFYNYYCYTILPFLIYGSIEGYKIIESKFVKKNIPLIPFLFFILGISLFRSSNDGIFPIKPAPIQTDKLQIVKSAISLIPPNARVNAQFDLSSFVKRNNPIYPMTMEPKDFLIFNFQDGITPYISLKELDKLYRRLVEEKKYKKIFEKEGVILIQKI